MLAVQDFSQKDEETVADFIRRLERHFRVAYGRDGLGSETRNTLLRFRRDDSGGTKTRADESPACIRCGNLPNLMSSC